MDNWKLIVLGAMGALIIAVLLEIWLRRGKVTNTLANTLGKSSTDEKNTKPELGMEEIDMDIVDAATRQNERHERRNWHRSKNNRNN